MASGTVRITDQSDVITGSAIIQVTVARTEDSDNAVTVEATVDTGFSGQLKLPPETVESLGLLRIGEPVQARLANDTLHEFVIHAASVLIVGRWRTVSVLVGPGKPLIGMALMWGCRLTLELREGGGVLIEEMADDS